MHMEAQGDVPDSQAEDKDSSVCGTYRTLLNVILLWLLLTCTLLTPSTVGLATFREF